MKFFLRLLERQDPVVIMFIAVAATLLLGWLDHLVGPDLSTAVFYLLPVSMAAWFGGRRFSVLICLLAAAIWTLTDITAGLKYDNPGIVYWNGLLRLALYLVMARLLVLFRERMQFEELAAATDVLTGLANRRAFYAELEAALLRARRYGHPLTVAYMDLDNFKQVNDSQGHGVGDQLLVAVARTLRDDLRNTDVVARLGGDEFAVLLTETDYAAADTAMQHANRLLLEAMRSENWPVTFSIGMVTFKQSLPESLAVIKIVDEVMYGVKKQTKNAIAHIVWPGDETGDSDPRQNAGSATE